MKMIPSMWRLIGIDIQERVPKWKFDADWEQQRMVSVYG